MNQLNESDNATALREADAVVELKKVIAAYDGDRSGILTQPSSDAKKAVHFDVFRRSIPIGLN
jgi:hypothetical protein